MRNIFKKDESEYNLKMALPKIIFKKDDREERRDSRRKS